MKSLSIFLLAWILPAFVYSNCVPNKWADYGEQKLKYVATSADNNHLWGIGPDDDVYYKASGGNWQLVPTPEKILVLSVSADGNKIWAINWQGNDLIRYGGINGEWSLVNDNVKNWIDITVSADGEHIAGIDENGGSGIEKAKLVRLRGSGGRELSKVCPTQETDRSVGVWTLMETCFTVVGMKQNGFRLPVT